MRQIKFFDVLARIHQGPSDRALLFDCDGTLITHDMASHMVWEMLRTGRVQTQYIPPEWKDYEGGEFLYNHFIELRNRLGHRMEIEEIFRWEFHALTGMAASELLRLSREVFDREVIAGLLSRIPETSQVLRDNTHRSYIVSGSPFHCVHPVGITLGLDPKRIFASRMKEDSQGILLPEIAPPGLVWGEAKRAILERAGVKRPWMAVGDSSGDLPILNWAEGVAWCVLTDSEITRMYSLRAYVEEFVLDGKNIPGEKGFYEVKREHKTWILQVH